jgi:hypothetical protein
MDDGVEAILHNARAMPPSLVSSCGVETEGKKELKMCSQHEEITVQGRMSMTLVIPVFVFAGAQHEEFTYLHRCFRSTGRESTNSKSVGLMDNGLVESMESAKEVAAGLLLVALPSVIEAV